MFNGNLPLGSNNTPSRGNTGRFFGRFSNTVLMIKTPNLI